MQRDKGFLAQVLGRYSAIEIDHAQGCYVVDRSGREYLDFTSGIAVTSTGYCHPRVVAAAQAQIARFIHAQANIFVHEPMQRLAEELYSVTPDGIEQFFFANSGAEAVEGSVKLAKRATGRPGVIVFSGGFHGRTFGAMSWTTSKVLYRGGYDPLLPSVYVAPYPYTYRSPFGGDGETCARTCLRLLDDLFSTQVAPDGVAAMLVEPVLGEGGYIVPSASFLHGLRQRCDDYGILLILDEVQTGFGRTGSWFAADHFKVKPDILTMAKGIASGFPLSAFGASCEVMDRWPRGSHGGTYGGNAVACAAAVATIEVLRDEKLVENARSQGERLLLGLRSLADRHPAVGEVRGLGLMGAVELTDYKGLPAPEVVREVRTACEDQGLLVLSCGVHDQVIRLVPPLTVGEREIDRALQGLGSALMALDAD